MIEFSKADPAYRAWCAQQDREARARGESYPLRSDLAQRYGALLAAGELADTFAQAPPRNAAGLRLVHSRD
ncbi:MAG TPA: hypothetical protein VFI49_08090 [Rudaea sp.]|nr:hypothetical protein [Rudaea sp.]